jgi:pyruvate kinase
MCKLFWGVVSIVINKSESFYETLTIIREKLLSLGIMESGDRVVVISPMPFTDSESANMIQVTQI